MSRRVARILAAAVLAGATGLAATVPALGQSDPFAVDTPEGGGDGGTTAPALLQYGWWNKAQQSPAGGTPTPAPPGAPADGLFVLYGPTGVAPPPAVTGPLGALPTTPPPVTVRPLGPEAFSAVRYAVPAFAEGTLSLRYAPTSSTQPGGVNPDVGEIMACPVTSVWDPVQNGRYNSAPTFDCGTGIAGVVAGDSVTFNFPASLSATGFYDLAIVPTGARPYRVGFARPEDGSVVLTSVPETETEVTPEAETTFEDPAAEATTFEPDTTTFEPPADFASEPTTDFVAEAPLPTVAPAPTARPQFAAPVAVTNPLGPDASRGERLLAVALLLLLAVGLWWIGGKPVRPPRLLGSLGNGQAVAGPEVRTGGIGRFARVRTGPRPPRLF